MNRHEFERAVDGSGLDPYSQLLLRYYASKKHWKDDGKVWVSAQTAAKETGLSVATVNRRVPYLRDRGWLVDTGERVGNGAIKYDLALGTPITQIVVKDSGENNPYQADSGTSITETRTSITESRTPITVIDKEVKNMKEEVIEEVSMSPAATAPVDEVKLREESEYTQDNYLVLLNRGERTTLEKMSSTYGATLVQTKEAAYLLKTNRVSGLDFVEKVTNALIKTGVEIDEW